MATQYASFGNPTTNPETDAMIPYCEAAGRKWAAQRHTKRPVHILVEGVDAGGEPRELDIQILRSTGDLAKAFIGGWKAEQANPTPVVTVKTRRRALRAA
jgi:hypothetical protein